MIPSVKTKKNLLKILVKNHWFRIQVLHPVQKCFKLKLLTKLKLYWNLLKYIGALLPFNNIKGLLLISKLIGGYQSKKCKYLYQSTQNLF